MITASVQARLVSKAQRLDVSYFSSADDLAQLTLSVLKERGIAAVDLLSAGVVTHPNRFKRQLATASEPAVPFLRAFDVFEFLPRPADWLSVRRTRGLERLTVQAGDVLVTRSGRNLGPGVMVDDYLADFIPSDDLLRLRLPDEDFRHYAFAYINTATGQGNLRRDMTGSVIDHLSANQLANLEVPILPSVYEAVVATTKEAQRQRGKARETLSQALAAYAGDGRISDKRSRTWSQRSTTTKGRLDAAYCDPSIQEMRDELRRQGGRRLADVATVIKPAGRYKTYYVDEQNGMPLLSGRNLLQDRLISPKFISTRSIAAESGYELQAGSICCQADGRADERLGWPVMVTTERDGWLASGHVARIVPRVAEDAGWLWAAMASPSVQAQLAALACGSVVDALYEEDVAGVVLPPRLVDSAAIAAAWAKFADAARLEKHAAGLLATAMSEVIA